MIEVNTQTWVFLQSLALGFALGLFYDVFRILRLAVQHSSVLIFLEDVGYFTICAVVTFLFSLSTVNGHLRAFLMIGELLGATIYYFSLGALVMALSKAIIRFVKALFRLLYRVFLRPFVRLFRWFGKKAGRAAMRARAKTKKIQAKAKYSLKQRSILVYNLYRKHPHGECTPSADQQKHKRGDASNGKSRRKAGKRKKGAVA